MLDFKQAKFKKLAKTQSKFKDATGKLAVNAQNMIKRHGGVLGLCAIVSSSPYEIPPYLPDVLTYLCAFVNDPAPIQVLSEIHNLNSKLILFLF